MSEIGGWLYAVFVISLSAGAVEIFAPVGETKKYIKYVISLVVLIAVVSPLVRAVGFAPKMIEALSTAIEAENVGETGSIGDERIYGELVEAGRCGIEKSICESVCDRFSIDAGDVGADVMLDDSDLDNIGIESVTLCISKNVIMIPESDIVTYVKEITGCERVMAVDKSEAE